MDVEDLQITYIYKVNMQTQCQPLTCDKAIQCVIDQPETYPLKEYITEIDHIEAFTKKKILEPQAQRPKQYTREEICRGLLLQSISTRALNFAR